MKRTGSIACALVVLVVCTVMAPELYAQSPFVTIEGRKFMVDGQEFYPRALNYRFEFASNILDSTDPDELYLTPAGVYDKMIGSLYECNTPALCNADLQVHFAKLTSMGFNTIRAWATPEFRRNGSNTSLISLQVNHNAGNEWAPSYFIDFSSPLYEDPISIRYFDLIRNLLDQAQFAGIKIILLCQRSNADAGVGYLPLNVIDNQEIIDLYSTYLARLASELAEHPALLAYDLMNEPKWGELSELDLMFRPKAEICSITTQWYDALKSNDPNHLVTLNGANIEDLDSWDPSAMKLDFYSPHIYPKPELYQDYNINSAFNRIKDVLYWLGKTCPMHYMIGETGFSAEDDTQDPSDFFTGPDNQHLSANINFHSPPYMDGSEAEQASFAHTSMFYTRRYLGSGYSWWEFQNHRSANLGTAAIYPGQYLGNFYGPLKYGNEGGLGLGPPWDVENRWRDKDVVAEFEQFNLLPPPSSLIGQPPNYLNWGELANAPLNTAWYLIDQFGEPIQEAIAECRYDYYYTSNNHFAQNIQGYMVPNATGKLVLRGLAIPGQYVSLIKVKLKILGAPTVSYQNFSWPANESTVTYPREYMKFDAVVDPLTIGIGDYRDVKGWNTVIASNTLIEGNGTIGGSADFHARSSIHAANEFHAEWGSEVHLWTEQTFSNCSNPVLHRPIPINGNTDGIATSTRKQNGPSDALLQFAKPIVEQATVYPNPCRDMVVISVTSADAQFNLYDAFGRLLVSQTIKDHLLSVNMREYRPGLYVVRVDQGMQSTSTTISKIP